MTLTALDDVLRAAASVRVAEIEWYGKALVDLSREEDLGRLRAAMRVESLPGYVCACRGQVRFEFFDAQGELLTVVVLHHGISIAWQWESGNAELADGMVLLRWLKEHGLPGVLLSNSERPKRLAWIAAMPPALEEMAGDLVGHFETPADSSRVVRARRRMQAGRNACCSMLRRRLHATAARDRLHVVLAPVAQRQQRVVEPHSQGSQRVLDARRHLVEHLAVHQFVGLHLTQHLDEHLLADAGHGPAQFARPHRAVVQCPQDQRLPASADHVDRRVQAARIRSRQHAGFLPKGGYLTK